MQSESQYKYRLHKARNYFSRTLCKDSAHWRKLQVKAVYLNWFCADFMCIVVMKSEIFKKWSEIRFEFHVKEEFLLDCYEQDIYSVLHDF
jgi:hypothetical protein